MISNFNNLSNINFDIYGLKISVNAKIEYLDEFRKYHYEFIRENQFFEPEVEIFFKVENGEKWEVTFKENEQSELLYGKIYAVKKDNKKYYLIPDKDYPFVLMNQTINLELGRILKYEIFPMHASAISDGINACLLMGKSGSGKTTLSLALVKNGFFYFHDDITFLNKNSQILQYHRAITPRIKTVKLFPDLMESPYSIKYRDFDDNSIRWCINTSLHFKDNISPNCRLKYIIFPKYTPDKEFSFSKKSIGESIVGMMNNMRIPPTAYYGNDIIPKLNKILNGQVEVYTINYPNYNVAVDFIKNLYAHKENLN